MSIAAIDPSFDEAEAPELLGVDQQISSGMFPDEFEGMDEAPDPELLAALEDCPPPTRLRTTAPRNPDQAGEVTSIYQRLVDYGLLRKITDIVMAKVSTPWNLRDDTSQEVHTYWSSLVAKKEYQRNQVAHYAHISGKHAALKLRRTLGAVVVIPSAAFRSGRDSTFMNAIGAAVNPHDVDDFKDSIELSTVMEDNSLPEVPVSLLEQRLALIELSDKQRLVAYKTLVERKSVAVVARDLQAHPSHIERLLNQVTSRLVAFDTAKQAPAPAEHAQVDAEPRVETNRKTSKRGRPRRVPVVMPALDEVLHGRVVLDEE